MTNTSLETLPPLYAVIDLGSNSFHMLITRQLADSVQVVDKIKRKVLLASGLNENNILSAQSIDRGLTCLRFFAERLQDIPPKNIRIVATATVRLAENRQEFIDRAERILSHPITVLSGLEEAKSIYLGVAYTSDGDNKRLVFDIGGASTEIISGRRASIKKALSLDIGCVTFKQQYFPNNEVSSQHFMAAISAARKEIHPVVQSFKKYGWQCTFGGSGTMQALAEILTFQQKPTLITLSFLYEIRKQLTQFETISSINIPGLSQERAPVITSGVAILIALFEEFAIKELMLSNGALREGLLYGMLPNISGNSVRQHTIKALAERFHIDRFHANRVKLQMQALFSQVSKEWELAKDNSLVILSAGCQLHEIGLLLSFKQHSNHAAYILSHADLAGFNQAERQLLVTFVLCHKGVINRDELDNQTLISPVKIVRLLTLMRLAIILVQRRNDLFVPSVSASVSENHIELSLTQEWLELHPLISEELQQEQEHLLAIGIRLTLIKI